MSLTHIADKIDADGVVAVEFDGEFEFGTDAVGGGHQHRFAIAARRNFEHCPEAADAGEYAGTGGGTRQRFDGIHQRVAGVDIHAGIAVGEGDAGLVHGVFRGFRGGVMVGRRPGV